MKFSSFLKLYLPPLGALLIVSLICLRFDIPVEVFMRDPMDLMQGVPWVGLISNVGALLWAATVSICFFTAKILSARQAEKRQTRLLRGIGMITALIMVDDLFLMHEIIYLKYLHLHQIIVFAFYGLLLLGCLFNYRDLIFASTYLCLALSFMFFGLSVVFDLISEIHILPWHWFFEDGFKFLGIVSWMGYWAILSSSFLETAKKQDTPRKR